MVVEIRERCECGAKFANKGPSEGWEHLWEQLEEWQASHAKQCALPV